MKLLTKTARIKIEIDDAWVLARAVPFREMIEIRDTCEISSASQGEQEDGREFDQNAFSLKMWVAAITDWGGIFDISGDPLPCTDDTKVDVFEMNIDFVNRVTEQAAKTFTSIRERDEKNLPPGVNGTSRQAESPVKIAGKSANKPATSVKNQKG